MIEFRNLNISYKDKRVINNINCKFNDNSITAIIGESGTGKTSLAMAMLGLNEGNVSGEIMIDGENILDYSVEQYKNYRWNKTSIVFQNVDSIMNPMNKIINQVIEPMIAHRYLSGKDAKERAVKLLKLTGVDEELFNKYPSQLSGGQLQRVQLAAALSNDPDILILDEPTSALDPLTKKEIISLIKKIYNNKIIIIITHDFSVARDLADNIVVLYGGKVMECGDSEDVLVRSRHPYTRGLLRSYPNMSTTKDLQGIKGDITWTSKGCPFANRCTQKIDVCLEKIPKLKYTDSRFVACHRDGIVKVLRGEGLHKKFNDKEVLKNIEFNLFEGETLAVVGESGSGKTTLANCIMGLEKLDNGKLYFENKEIIFKGRNLDFYKKVQMVYQNPKSSINMKFSILEIVREPLDVQKIGTKDERKGKVIKALEDVRLPNDDKFINKSPEKLSGGELQRIAIARALVLNPRILVADEPTSALDVSVQAKIMKLLLNLQEQKGLSIIFITHDIALARKVSDNMIVMKEGSIVENGMSAQLISKPSKDYTINLINAASKIM